jgi:hypothetical protein
MAKVEVWFNLHRSSPIWSAATRRRFLIL